MDGFVNHNKTVTVSLADAREKDARINELEASIIRSAGRLRYLANNVSPDELTQELHAEAQRLEDLV